MAGTTPRLTFYGAAGTVTGSKYLLEAAGKRLLLDCGLFQGVKALRQRNWAPPPFDVHSIDAVVLSHAHLDHAGYLPALARAGFRGPVHCTTGTADLLQLMLVDSARLQEEDARRANLKGYTKHTPALPLYTEEDARLALSLLVRHPYGEEFEPIPGHQVVLRRAGHILGSASVEVVADKVRLVFSGDLGRPGRPILRDPEPVRDADVLLVEATYGDRVHARDPDRQLARIITETASRGGTVVVPSFAVGRAQDLLYTLRRMEDANILPLVQVVLDSPLAQDVTEVYCHHPEDHDLDMNALKSEGRNPLAAHAFRHTRTPEESRALNDRLGPMVIIAGSGMATGGRVLHHLKWRLPDHRNTVLLAGYQAAGTRGRALQEGAPTVRIHGQDIPVRARIETVDGMSAHADREETLAWLRNFRRAPKRTYVVHAEPLAAQALAEAIRTRLGWEHVEVAQDGATVALKNAPRGRSAALVAG